METLGQRIHGYRLKKGFTQIELAKGLCTPSMISQIESDRARPSYKMLVGLASRLEVPLEHLLKEVDLEMEYTSKYKLAMGMMRAKEFGTAISLLDSLLQAEQHRIAKEHLMLEVALCHLELGNAEEAESRLNQLHQMVNTGVDENLLVLVLLYLGRVGMLKNEYQIALYHTNMARDELLKQEVIDPELKAKILLQLASLHEKIDKAAEATKYYEQAFQLHFEDSVERGRIYLRMAEVYDRQKKYELAEECALKASVLLQEQANAEQKREMQHRLIMLQREKSDWKVGVQKLLTLAEQLKQIGDKSKAGEVFADIAFICSENGEIDESWAYAEKARMSLPDTSPKMGQVHRVLSFVYFHREDEEKGKRHLDNSVKIYERDGKFAEFEEVTLQMCRYLNEKGEHREAFERMELLHTFMTGQLEQRGIVL